MSDPEISTADRLEMLAQTSDLHRQLDGTRVLITGGTGFFGRWLLDSWVDASIELGLDRVAVVVTRDPDAARRAAPRVAAHPSVEFVAGDVLGAAPVGGTFDAAIHAATAASLALTQADPRLMFDTVVTGTANVLDWLAPSGRIPMLLTSSGAVYGRQPPEVPAFDEGHLGGPDPLDAGAVYAEAKRAAEMLCAVTGGIDTKIARCFAFVGPHLPIDAHFAIGNFVRDGLAGRDIVLHGDGTPVRSYMYATDLVAWLWTILLRGQAGRAYNVGSPDGHDLAAVAQMVADQCDGVDVDVRGTPVPGAAPHRYVPSTERATVELGLRISVPIDDAIERTLSWHRNRR